MLAEVLLGLLHIGLNGSRIRVGIPVGRADFSVLLDELEGFDQAQNLVDGSAHGQIINGVLAQDAIGVNDEGAAQRDALLVQQHIVVGRDLLGQIGEERVLQLAHSAVLAVDIAPGEMAEVGVHGNAQNLGVNVMELLDPLAKCNNFSGANECAANGIADKEMFNATFSLLTNPVGRRRAPGTCPCSLPA